MENLSLGITKLKPFNEGKLMEGIFDYQDILVTEYIRKGSIPPLPIDLNNRQDQQFLRATAADIVEELSEFFQHVEDIAVLMQGVYISDDIQEKIRAILPKLAEELMDALHFWVELFMYSNISFDDMLGFYKDTLEAQGLGDTFLTADALTTAMMYARNLNINSEQSRIASFSAFRFTTKEDVTGAKQGPELYLMVERLCWDVTRKLLMARNKLKSKPWRETTTKPNVQAYQEELMNAWVSFTLIMDLMEMSAKMVYTEYEKKNLINQRRIYEGY